MNQLYNCMKYPTDTSYTLQCTDNPMADLTEETSGEKVFYVVGDRHF